jgi:hypothetical protein
LVVIASAVLSGIASVVDAPEELSEGSPSSPQPASKIAPHTHLGINMRSSSRIRGYRRIVAALGRTSARSRPR